MKDHRYLPHVSHSLNERQSISAAHFPPHTPRPIGSCPQLPRTPPMSDVSCLSSTSPFPKIKRPSCEAEKAHKGGAKNLQQFRWEDCVRAAEETPNGASLIPFPSLAGQMAIVHQAVLLAPAHHSPAPSQGIRLSDSGSTDKMKSPGFAQIRCIYRGDKPEA